MTRNPGKRSMIRSAFDAMIEARARKAERYVNGALLMLDDEALRARGISRNELVKGDGAPLFF